MSRQHPFVLLVAADALVRRDVAATLEIYGHRVVAAASGREALDAMAQPGARAAILVVDADLRGEIDGLAVAKEARRLNPKIAVVYTARLPHMLPAARQVSGAPVIRTPYHPHQLAGVIAMLRQDGRGAALEAA